MAGEQLSAHRPAAEEEEEVYTQNLSRLRERPLIAGIRFMAINNLLDKPVKDVLVALEQQRTLIDQDAVLLQL